MNQLSTAKRAAVVAALCEGNSIRSTARLTNVSKPTILKLLVELGDACARFHDERVRNVNAARIQCDEVWQYVYAKAKNVPEEKQGVFSLWGTFAKLDHYQIAACSLMGFINS